MKRRRTTLAIFSCRARAVLPQFGLRHARLIEADRVDDVLTFARHIAGLGWLALGEPRPQSLKSRLCASISPRASGLNHLRFLGLFRKAVRRRWRCSAAGCGFSVTSGRHPRSLPFRIDERERAAGGDWLAVAIGGKKGVRQHKRERNNAQPRPGPMAGKSIPAAATNPAMDRSHPLPPNNATAVVRT